MSIRFEQHREWPGVELAIQDLAVLPESPRRWEEQALQWRVPERVTVERLESRSERGTTGWPIRLIAARLRDAGDRITCHRLYALYSFLDFGGVVVVSGTAEALERHRAEILAFLISAQPDWSREIASDHQLWEGVDWA